MAFKLLILSMLFVFAGAGEIKGGGAAPLVHVIHAANNSDFSEIYLDFAYVKTYHNGYLQFETFQKYELKRNEEYKLRVPNVTAGFNTLFTGNAGCTADVVSYDPVRDKGQPHIYWKADNKGVSMSYDNKHYKFIRWYGVD